MSTARESIENCWDRATPVAPLLDAYRDDLIPAWEAVYEPGNVSDYLIGYTNAEIPAKRAAEAWYQAQRYDEPAAIDWIADPVLAVHEYDVWHELVEVDENGEVLAKPGVIVRHRKPR